MECFVGSCSGQVCSDHEGVISTCEWRPRVRVLPERDLRASAVGFVRLDAHRGAEQLPRHDALSYELSRGSDPRRDGPNAASRADGRQTGE